MNRRPVASRSTSWAQSITKLLVSANISPNQISMASILFAILGAWGLLALNSWVGLLIFALSTQLRLLCNLFDGMVAIASGKSSPIGEIYNELPDRISDSIFFIALGYACNYPHLGMLAALFATLTVYIRLMGGNLGLPQNFIGPMAKQHRMTVVFVSCIFAIIEGFINNTNYSLVIGLSIVFLGSVITCFTRLHSIANNFSDNLKNN